MPVARASQPLVDTVAVATASDTPAVIPSPAAGLTTGPEPSTTLPHPDQREVRTDLLPDVSLTVEEVGPGVLRVLGDGVRDLSSLTAEEIFSGRDGSLWLRKRDRSIKLGRPGSLEGPFATGRFEIAPDGTVWTLGWRPGDAGSTLYSFDGTSWTAHEPPIREDPEGWEPADLEVAADGSVWVTWYDPRGLRRGPRLTRLGPDGWRRLGRVPESLVGDLVVTDSGEVWIERGARRYEHGVWRRLRRWALRGWVGRGGAVWLRWASGRFLRFEDGSRQRCLTVGQPEGFRPRAEGLSVAPDGSLWGRYATGRWSVGLARFDCWSWQYPLPGIEVGARADIAFADDGSVWVLTAYLRGDEAVLPVNEDLSSRKVRQLYVITPQAVASGA